jgi:hypothetical protein
MPSPYFNAPQFLDVLVGDLVITEASLHFRFTPTFLFQFTKIGVMANTMGLVRATLATKYILMAK